MNIFSKLPTDIIHAILLYDEHFIMRKGEIVSIIPKSDIRYKLLSFITLTLHHVSKFNFKTIYKYHFNNLYDYKERTNNGDLMQVEIKECKKSVTYYIWTGKQYPKSFCNKEQPYMIESPYYRWKYLEYKYVRK